MYPTVEQLQDNRVVAILTGHTCGEACWHAVEDVCRCSCGGKNHGILRRGGKRPERTMRQGTTTYQVAAITHEYHQAKKQLEEELRAHCPGLAWYRYGDYRDFAHMPVIVRKASTSQLKWPEVQAVAENNPSQDVYIVWRAMPGTKYGLAEGIGESI